jgi:hypothetical protein
MFKKYSNIKTILKFQKKLINTDIAMKLSEFINIMNILLEEKIYHYSLFNYETKELISLQKLSKEHLSLINEYLNKNNKIFNHSFIKEKVTLFNSSTVFMDYKSFIDLIKYIHEQKEEQINNLLRDEYEEGISDKDNDILIKIRDEWRNCILPDVLDSNANPIYVPSILNKVNSEINKNLMNILI